MRVPPSVVGTLNRVGGLFIKPDARGDDRFRRMYMLGLIALFTPVALWVGLDDLRAGRYLEVSLVGVLVLPLLASLVVTRFADDIRLGYRLVSGASVVGTGMLLATGAGEGYAFVFFFFFPAGLCYTLGSREGGVWFLVSLAVYAGVLAMDVGTPYPEAMKLRFLFSYAVLGLLAWVLQRSRDGLLGALARDKAELQDALANVRTLGEMIPMCAWCGKLRDDEGYWSRIEEYLNSEAGALVSHALCPDCEGRVLPEADGAEE